MQSFAFDSERITKSSIQSTETYSRYTTRTVKHVLSQHCTILEDSTGTVCATIDWRERTLELGGKKASIEQLKRKVSNFSMCVSACGVFIFFASIFWHLQSDRTVGRGIGNGWTATSTK